MDKEHEIFNELIFVRTLVSYEINDNTLMLWSKSINRHFPDVEINTIKEVIRAMQFETLDFYIEKGVQNIFFGIRYWEALGEHGILIRENGD